MEVRADIRSLRLSEEKSRWLPTRQNCNKTGIVEGYCHHRLTAPFRSRSAGSPFADSTPFRDRGPSVLPFRRPLWMRPKAWLESRAAARIGRPTNARERYNTPMLHRSAFFLLSLPAFAQIPFTHFVVFGDSLSDNGNLYYGTSLLGLPTPGPPSYATG